MGRMCFHFHRWIHESSGRRSLCRINLGCPKTKNWGPSNDTPIPNQSIRRHGPLVPILPKRPSGSCHHKGPIWVSSGDTIWPSSRRKTKGGDVAHKTKRKKGASVCVCVAKLSQNNPSFQRMYTESKTTQTCGAWDTCKQGGSHQRVTNSTCL